MLFKRILALTLTLVLVASMLPAAGAFGREPLAPESQDRCCSTIRVDTASPNYTRPAYDGKLIEITPQRVEDHFRYLDEVYVQKHPEAALVVNTGDDRDKEMLKTLAETITAGCNTPTEKANAIDRWLHRNIYYDVDTSAYATDTFLDRTGNCLSYANLMQYLLRSLGIPAVVGDGWRGDMKTSTVDLFNYEGHAWCFVHLNGQWVLYDPLWLNCGTTDRDYIAEWIYLDTIEFITPAYDGENLPPEAWAKPKVYYTGGTWYGFNDGAPNGYGNFTQFVNNQGYNFTMNQDEWLFGLSDGWSYVDGTDDHFMNRGEVYRDGWISYGDYADGTHIKMTYAHHNGMQIDGAVMEYDGQKLYMGCNTAYPILADEEDYTISYGVMTFRTGYTGPFVGKYWGDYYNTDDHKVVWTSENPEVATVDENGNITAKAPGWATIKIQLIREDIWEGVIDSASLSTNYINILISDEVRLPDYTDHDPCEHNYVLNGKINATCESWGYELHICTLCGSSLELMTDEPLGHNHTASSTTPATCVAVGSTTYTCSRCSDSYTEELPIDPEGHGWDGTECTLCGDTRLTPFDDVKEESFYEAPVAWAVEGGITNGVSATDFGPDNTCNRAQVVTFLWRAAGCPEPESMDNPFVDVAVGSFYEKPVLWAVENGVTNGTDATHFGPGEPCNRASVVTFLWRAAGKPAPAASESPFADVPEGTWYAAPVLWAMENGITNGISATAFGATSACNRAQVVTFLFRAFGE